MIGQITDNPEPYHAPLLDPSRQLFAGAIPQDEYDVDTPWHSHQMHQLQYAFSGIVEVEDDGGTYMLPRALAAWIPAGVSHRTKIHFVRSGSVYLSPALVPAPGDRIRIVQVSPLMREMVLGAMRWPLTIALDDTGKKYFEAFASLCGEWIGEEAHLRLPHLRGSKVEAVAAHTYDNLASCDFQSICKQFGFSERTLRRQFQKAAGMSWEGYRQRARLLRAAVLLSEGALPIETIAANVGFESQSAFARAFKELMGSSPRQFRES
jgi:AraC-like DNA-binding protein